jgi:hypothetical protein
MKCDEGSYNCLGVCTDLDTDPKNCGECGNACAAGQTCTDGGCDPKKPLCGEHESACGTGKESDLKGYACVNLASNVKNCGECGNACAAGQMCVEGGCANQGDLCIKGESVCGAEEPPYYTCVDLMGNVQHCGECGNACADGQKCMEGGCTSETGTCSGGKSACEMENAQGVVCVDLMSNPMNCGECGNACEADVKCVNGGCGGKPCAEPGWVMCGSVCQDLSGDMENCGWCGHSCNGHDCVDGICGK